MTDIEPYLLLAIGVIAVAAVMLAVFHLLRSYRQRRLNALRGGAANPTFAADRAYNRLALARREADLLEAQGTDVDRARQLIDLANRSLTARDADRAYELAQAAHETLVQARRDPLRSRAAAADGAGAPSPTPTPPVVPSAAPTTAATPAVAKNRAEAQFQLRLFEQDLVTAGKDAPGAQPSAPAREMYVQAHAAFDRADYAEAFRLSLRGRRRVGGHVESLGPPTPSPSAGDGRVSAANPATAAEEVAAQDRCPSCGHPTVAGDTYCRGCGAVRASATCAACGAPRAPNDQFCGRCGQRYR
ncbi:MAG TPA: zinc ribbon domain-containing protein [Thermoplasmata archaeon]|nr:zinc ribbon domain-containing protein [Thermoplasmata archaeon]